MALDDRQILEAERDVPIAIGDDSDTTRFAQFYLERTSQNSNIYFVEAHEEAAASAHPAHRFEEKRIRPEASPVSMIWRLAWLSAAAGAIAIALFVVPRVIPAGMQARNADFDGAYRDVLAAQGFLSSRAVEDALEKFRVAHERIAAQPPPASGMASVIYAAYGFITGNAAPMSSLDAVLADVVKRTAASAAPLEELSFSSFMREEGNRSAGGIMERALSEAKNAEAAIENAERTLIIAEEDGNGVAARAQLGPQLSLMKANLERYIDDLELGSWALGMEYPRRFLIVAQDPRMARPTGGIIRSLGIATAQKGAITDVSFGEVYGIDSQLQVNVIPPEPIQKTATAWGIHSANWFFDFPLSAQKIAYFYEKSGGKRIDGVIAVNDRLLKRLLAITGPVTGKGGMLVNAESMSVAEDPAALSALANVIGTLDGEKAQKAFSVIIEGLAERDALVWAADRDRESAVAAKGWDGRIGAPADADYLAVVATDIEGTGVPVQGNIWKETVTDEEGMATHTVVAEFPRADDERGERLRYLRIYVPKGSELLEVSENAAQTIVPQIDYEKQRFAADPDIAESMRTLVRDETSGVDIYDESGMTVFAMWMLYDEKGSRAVVRYRTPIRISGSFASVFQKQPGADMALHYSVIAPDGKTISSPDGFTGEFHGELSRDIAFVMTMQ